MPWFLLSLPLRLPYAATIAVTSSLLQANARNYRFPEPVMPRAPPRLALESPPRLAVGETPSLSAGCDAAMLGFMVLVLLLLSLMLAVLSRCRCSQLTSVIGDRLW